MFDNPFNPSELLAVAPEIGLTIWAFFILSLDFLKLPSMNRRALGLLSALGMLAVMVLSAVLAPPAQKSTLLLGGMVRNDLFAYVFDAIFIVAGALTCLASIDFRPVKAGGEFYALIILATMGMCLMAASNDIILLYLATETSSMALYLLAGFMRDTPRSAEAGIKYFIFGAVASTIMLYGLSLVYGLSGHTGYQDIATAIVKLQPGASSMMAVFALLLVVVGFAFKTTTVPFHFWAPDVYEGAPTPVTGFISTASKAAGFAILIRFLLYVFSPMPQFQTPASLVWVAMMQPIAILTMFLGNLLAITQTNVKRMLAYSSVAQAGYIMIGVTALGYAATRGELTDALPTAIAAVIFYIATYMFTNIGAFAIVGLVSQRVGGDDLKDFNGLSRRSPYLALGMVAVLLSLTGAPPLVGFVGKLFLFRSAINETLVGLTVIGVINVLISVFYYLGVVRAMYVDRSPNEARPFPAPVMTRWVVIITSAAVLLITIISTPFWDLALAAAKSFLN
ncbi:MAG: NADH-quinone oxidoreductase subunit N [Chloroflexi bacterium]|nr:NADH-quinone oxidoreductase subunit N [Chloroflexota bacterium]MCL5274846.1 NADH-quinone oxidoreductase subunit N [Chloroflexota bacterium]